MAQIKIVNFEFERAEGGSANANYKLSVDFEFIVSKVELLECKNYAVQFSIGGTGADKQKFKLVGCEMPLSVSIKDYTLDTLNLRQIDNNGRLHYLLHHVCEHVETTNAENNKYVNDIDSVFVMADLFSSDNHALLGFTGSASKKIRGASVL